MSRIFIGMIKNELKGLYATDFQRFVEELFLTYFKTKFTPIKDKRDKGCDGILNDSRTVLAVYGPEKRDLARFQRKIGKDFRDYEEHWIKDYPNWQVAYNLTFTAAEIQFIDSLKQNTGKIGPEHLVEMIRDLKWVEKRRIAEFLGINDQFFYHDILSTVIDDLLSQSERDSASIPYIGPIYIEDKINLNFSEEEIQSAKDHYTECLMYFGTLRDLLKGYSDIDQTTLKSTIRRSYSRLAGPFPTRLQTMIEQFSLKSPNDDEYKTFLEIVFLYYFEQCLIGDKTPSELL